MNRTAATVAERMRLEWLVELTRLQQAILETKMGQRLPDNYWMAERNARRRLAVADVLAEELPGEA